MAVQTWVARFLVDHGQVTEEGGRLRTFQRRRLDEPDTDLHLLAEPDGPEGDDLGAQALDAIGRLFVRDNLSLTGGLVRALRSTHQMLVDWNRRSVAREQVGVGLTAAAVRGATVYLAQVGPSLVYLKQAGVLSRFVAEEESADPLGTGAIEPSVRRVELAPGDLLLAASRALEARIDSETLEALLTRGSEDALPELYLLTRDLPSFALFAVTCFDNPEAEAAPAETSATAEATAVEEPRPSAPALSFAGAEDTEQPGHQGRLPAAAPPPLDISRPVVRLRRDQVSSRGEYPRTTGPATRFRLDLPLPRFFAIGAAAVLLFFIAAFAVPDLVRENRQEKASTLIERAQGELEAAAVETNPGQRRVLLGEAKRLAGEAVRIEPGNPAATGLYAQASSGLQALDAVVAVAPATITTLSRQVTGDVSIERIVVGPGMAYLLDARGRRVLALPLTAGAAPVAIFEDGTTYAGTAARRPMSLTWDDRGGRLLILDGERRLFEVRPGGAPQPLALRRSGNWASVSDIAAYDGNLYVLDPKANQVHRYIPASAGFDSEPADILGGASSLASATGLAINADVFVLGDDGKVRRFRNGGETPFTLGGIDRSLVSPRSLAVLPSLDEVMIADTGNKRVVVADRDGLFRRQLVSNAFTDLRAIALDPAGGQLYAVAGDAVLSVDLRATRGQ